MTVTTSRGTTYEPEWIDGPTITSGQVLMRLATDRPLGELAAELDGLAWIRREDEQQGNKEWNTTRLAGIYRDGDKVTVSFALEG